MTNDIHSSANDPNSDLERLRGDYLKQLLDRYEARSKGFRKLLFSFVGFGLLFLLLVLLPFIGLHRQRHAVASQLAEVTQRSGVLDTLAAGYRKAAAGLETLHRAIDHGAFELHDALQSLAQPAQPVQSTPQTPFQANAGPSQLQPPDSCQSIPNANQMNCRVAEQVRGQFQRYRGMLEAGVLGPIRELPASSEAQPDTSLLRAGLDSLNLAFEARLTSRPRFWERFSGKEDFFGSLEGDVDKMWRGLGFDAQQKSLEKTRREVSARKADLEKQRKMLEQEEDTLLVRMAQIESPLGKLPVGLLEAVQIFPLLMAIGFVWCGSVLLELVAIRSALYQGYRRRDPEQAALTDRQLNLVAPLWIDPAETRAQETGAGLVLLAPILLYAVGCSLVLYFWIALATPGTTSTPDRWLYGTLYLAAAFGLCVTWRRVHRAARIVRSEQVAPMK